MISLKDPNFIEDEYVSPLVLPKEPLFGWVKWDDNADFDKVVLKYEADVKINTLFDVDKSVRTDVEGVIEIPKSMLQVGGFFGFNATYDVALKSKRQISFHVELVSKEEIRTITLSSCVTKPEVEIIGSTRDQIIIDNDTPPQSTLSFDIRMVGDTIPINTEVVMAVTGQDLKFEFSSPLISPNEITSFDNESIPVKDITIRGKGNGFIVISLEYSDVIGNRYSEIIQEIPVLVKSNNAETISFKKNMSYEEELLYVTT